MNYELVYNFKNVRHNYGDYLNLIKKSFDEEPFEEWMIRNKWDKNFVPFGLIDKSGRMVAACSAHRTEFCFNDQKYLAMQLGRIFIRDKEDKELITKKLIDLITKKYDNIVDVIYSFEDFDEDEKILEEIGFKKIPKYSCYMNWKSNPEQKNSPVKRLNLKNQDDLDHLILEIKHTSKMSGCTNTKGDALIKTYNIIKYYPNDVFYVPSLSTTIVSVIKNQTFYLIGAFSNKEYPIENLLNLIVPKNINRIVFGFVPISDNVIVEEVRNDDMQKIIQRSQLFIKPINLKITNDYPKMSVLAQEKSYF